MFSDVNKWVPSGGTPAGTILLKSGRGGIAWTVHLAYASLPNTEQIGDLF